MATKRKATLKKKIAVFGKTLHHQWEHAIHCIYFAGVSLGMYEAYKIAALFLLGGAMLHVGKEVRHELKNCEEPEDCTEEGLES